MIVLKIDMSKIEDRHLFVKKNGSKSLDAVFHDKPNDYGDDGFITQSPSKEARDKGERGPIIGNWRNIGSKPKQATQKPPAPKASKPVDDDNDPAPF